MSENTHDQVDMSPVYARYPVLAKVEAVLDPRFERRRPILNYIPKWKRGAEIGVFTGQFSELLIQIAKPIKYFAVDPWELAFGEHFPNWGEYTANGTLSTEAAYQAASHRLSRFPEVEIVTSKGVEWINSLDESSLDWAYVDSTHQYEPTLAELNALATKLAPDGILFGDDCWCRREHRHYGVFRAVRDFCRQNNFEIMLMDHAGQWAARRSID
ncbi:class I SAM-dependent methyltransferase [Hoeflea ulvae]|uniref:Class I SAM-dependent methyltransferase n=1 Tax=Hoeflea ulvae TaxID=2983764 RepID=A0ABT3YKH5_9HYPH|nr:class I SAM-dependent methyltransferase [Hoeflea ulvae]MCY0096399.1 class I SAM-dependent methyltransferase [Hoeflea ulvae]